MGMQQMQMQWQMQQGQQAQQYDAPPEEASAAGGPQLTLNKLDISAGLEPAAIKNQIMDIAKGLIGDDEEVEIDSPLMESGLTSNTAVLLRDALTQTLPGLNLPVTLVFDYPSIGSMTDLIMEKAAKKKLKG